MSLVLDANVVLGWAFGRSLPAWSQALLRAVREQGAIAPDLLRYEAGRVVERRAAGASLSAERAAWFADFFAGLPIAYDARGVETQYAAAWRLAAETGLTVKDAAYLELAVRAGLDLATRDRALLEVARGFKVFAPDIMRGARR